MSRTGRQYAGAVLQDIIVGTLGANAAGIAGRTVGRTGHVLFADAIFQCISRFAGTTGPRRRIAACAMSRTRRYFFGNTAAIACAVFNGGFGFIADFTGDASAVLHTFSVRQTETVHTNVAGVTGAVAIGATRRALLYAATRRIGRFRPVSIRAGHAVADRNASVAGQALFRRTGRRD